VTPKEGGFPLAAVSALELGEHRCRSGQAAADPAALGEYLSLRPEFLKAGVVRELAEVVRQQVHVNVDRALELADAALAIADQIQDAESLGLANRAKANALCFRGKFQPAIELFQIAIGQFACAGATEELARTLASSIQPLAKLGEYDQALEAAGRARKIFRETGDLLRLARLEINVANIHQRRSRFGEALASYQLAYEQLQPYKDQEAMAAALHNMAVCLIIRNDFHRALETYHRARKVSERHNMPLLVAQADYNIAYLYFLRGDYQRAIEGLRAARKLCQKNGDEYHFGLCDLDESEIYLELNLSAEAASLAQRAQKQFQKLGTAFEAGRSLVNFAIARHQQSESAAALDLFREAHEIFSREGNPAWQALIELYRAMVLWETGQGDVAAEACRAALSFFIGASLHRRAILCYLLLARIAHATHGRGVETRRKADLHSKPETGEGVEDAEQSTLGLAEAQEHIDAALRMLGTIDAPLLGYHAHLIAGDLHRTRGNPRQSHRSYLLARRNLEALRGRLQGEELKIAFMKNKVEVYEKLVQIYLPRTSPPQKRRRHAAAEKAFAYMEQAKSRSLVELIFGRANPLSCLLPKQAGERLTSLHQELNWHYRRLEIEQTRPEGIAVEQIQNLQTQARALEDELLQAIRELPGGGGAAAGQEALGTRMLDEIRATLGDDRTLVEYFQVGSRLVAAIVTGRDLEVIQLGESGEIAPAMRMLEFQLSKFTVRGVPQRESRRSLLAATESRLEELYRLLMAPLINKLRGRHLVVVPHGVLHYLPFHALSDGANYLIDRFTISYAPSASVYAICHRKQAKATGSSLLLGVHDKRTPWIRTEIRAVAEVLPDPQIRLGPQATAQVLRTEGASSRFIHIATHGVFRRDNPMFSSVRLADSYLNIYDLYQLQLPAELLTLSGCGTGLSVVAAGDELLGLIRGLLSAGAQSLLLSLWDVHDRTTAQFMAAFYSKLQKHSDKGEALREAMLELREIRPHPYYWAPFVLVGKSFCSSP
jgi:CHAT domain-containing protein